MTNNTLNLKLVKALGKVDIFADVAAANLPDIAELCEVVSLQPEEVIFSQDTKLTSLYILLEGAVELKRRALVKGREWEVNIGILSPVTAFGWSSFIPPGLATVSARSTARSQVARIAVDDLLFIIDTNPALGYGLTRGMLTLLSSRLRESYKVIDRLILDKGEEFLSKNLAARIYTGTML